MRNYEIMYIQRPEVEDEKRTTNNERFQAIITEQGGELINVEDMGRRRLAYEIDKIRDGFYVLVDFKSTPEVVTELERVIKINTDVIRYLIVRQDD